MEKNKNQDDSFFEHNQVLIESVQEQIEKERDFTQDKNHQAATQLNQRLKGQLQQLAEQLDQINYNKQLKKQQLQGGNVQDDELLKNKKNYIKEQMGDIQRVKNKIASIKKQLQNGIDVNVVREKEDELKRIKMELRAFNLEKEALEKVQTQQRKALNEIKVGEQDEKQLRNLRDQLRAFKEENKILQEKLLESEKNLRKEHSNLIIKEEKVKDLQNKIKEKKKQTGVDQNQEVSEEVIKQMLENIEKLDLEKKILEKKFIDSMKELEKEKRQLQQECERKLLLLKEREKELKINQLKVKEISRLIKNNQKLQENQQITKEDQNNSQYTELDQDLSSQRNGSNNNKPFGNKIKKSMSQQKIQLENQEEIDSNKKSQEC